MTAQEAFRVMMRERVAPELRQLGYKGSGQAFTYPSDRYWALLGFQKSDASSATAVKFTVNLTVVAKEAWARAADDKPYLGSRPSPNLIAPVGWNQRIGLLLPTGNDQWWWVEPDRPADLVATAVIAAIRDYGLPEMQRRMASDTASRRA